MSEYIKREAVEKAIDSVYTDLYPDYVPNSIVAFRECLLVDIGIIPAADVQPVKWISVKDGLPEDDGKYMVWYKGELDICEFDAESQTFGYTYVDYDEMYSELVCWDDDMDKDITHWMPRPKPPKDGDTE